MTKRLLIINSGGDCPGMNAVIWAIVKRVKKEMNWEVKSLKIEKKEAEE